MIAQQYTQIMTNWTDAEWKEAEALEKELYARLTEGLTEDAALTVVQAVMVLRKLPKFKSVTVGSIVDTALRLGAVELVKQAYPGAVRPKGKLAGKGVR